jgi:hypothetical protein
VVELGDELGSGVHGDLRSGNPSLVPSRRPPHSPTDVAAPRSWVTMQERSG